VSVTAAAIASDTAATTVLVTAFNYISPQFMRHQDIALMASHNWSAAKHKQELQNAINDINNARFR
jgi:hypothetical protein